MLRFIITLFLLFFFQLSISMGQINDPAPYCSMTFDSNAGGGMFNMINTLNIDGTIHTFSGEPFFGDFTEHTYQNSLIFSDFVKGGTVDVEIEFFSPNSIGTEKFGLYIDFDQNETFDQDELVMSNSNTIQTDLSTFGAPNVTATLDITIPNDALEGITRMRLIRGDGNFAEVPPCPLDQYVGCFYDFDVNITTGGTTVEVTSITVQGQNSLTDITTVAGTLQMEATVLPMNTTNSNVIWDVSDSNIATISNSGLLTAVTDGAVDITATAADGSGVSGTATIAISNQSSSLFSTIKNSDLLECYPNPSSDMLNISFEEGTSSNKRVKIISAQGILIKEVKFNETTLSLDVKSFPKGVYFIQIIKEEKVLASRRWVKM